MLCPVRLFYLMWRKLNPLVNCLWQRPKRSVTKNDPIWFDAVPVGRDPLNSMMKKISKNAGLSRIYTNHCIRATVVTSLDEKGFEARDIMATTGHKSEASIRSYSNKCKPKKRRAVSDALASNLECNEKIPKVSKAECTVSVPPENTPEIHHDELQASTDEDPQKENKNIQNSPVDKPSFDFNVGEDEISNNEIMQILTQIEKENAQIVEATEKQKTTEQQTQQITVSNVNNVNNVANVSRPPLMPNMYFGGNSTVHITYNFVAK